MITWWQLAPSYLLCIIPWLVAAIPNISGKAAIGGYIRQFLANSFIGLLPDDKVFQYQHFFMGADGVGEYIAVLPILILLTVLFMWVIYLIGSLAISVHNLIVNKTQKSIIDANKR